MSLTSFSTCLPSNFHLFENFEIYFSDPPHPRVLCIVLVIPILTASISVNLDSGRYDNEAPLYLSHFTNEQVCVCRSTTNHAVHRHTRHHAACRGHFCLCWSRGRRPVVGLWSLSSQPAAGGQTLRGHRVGVPVSERPQEPEAHSPNDVSALFSALSPCGVHLKSGGILNKL